jgi:hypothetical protein
MLQQVDSTRTATRKTRACTTWLRLRCARIGRAFGLTRSGSNPVVAQVIAHGQAHGEFRSGAAVFHYDGSSIAFDQRDHGMREHISIGLNHVHPCIGSLALSFMRESLERCTQFVNVPNNATVNSSRRWHSSLFDERAELTCGDSNRRCSLNLAEAKYNWQKWQYVDSRGRALHGPYRGG